MKEGISKVKCLLAVELCEISSNYIYDLRENRKNYSEIFSSLPEFTLDRNNHIVKAEYYHQYIGFEKLDEPKKYLYFDLCTQDNLLFEEMNSCGAEALFKDIDFKKVLSVFEPPKEKNLKQNFGIANYLVVELTYITTPDYANGGYDCDMSLEIPAYLNNNLIYCSIFK